MVVVLFFFVSAAAFAAFINFADSIEDCGGQTNFGLKMATDLELPNDEGWPKAGPRLAWDSNDCYCEYWHHFFFRTLRIASP